MSEMRIDYVASSGLEPHDPELGLGFWSVELGEASFADVGLVTVDADTDDYRGGGGRYYRRQFTEEEFNDKTDLRIEVTVKVFSSGGSPASTCVQFTTDDGRTFGLGFLRQEGASEDDKVILYSDSGETVPSYGQYRTQDWLWQPVILGRYSLPINVTRTYVLELLRQGTDGCDDVVRLSVKGLDQKPLTLRLVELKRRPAVPGLLFGHPVKQGAGSTEWQRLTITTTGRRRQPDLPRRIGNNRQLFLDDWIIAECDNLQCQLGTPEKYSGNPVMRRDKPWDAVRCDLYGSAVWEPQEKKLQLFYSAMSNPASHDDKLAYAESNDGGRTWVKPDLGLFPFGEHKHTNLVWMPSCQFVAGPCVFRDEQDPDSSRRYKMFSSDYGERPGVRAEPGIYVAFSPDGVHWQPSNHNPVLPLISDTAHGVFWDQRLGKYVGYVRAKPAKYGRAVARTESEDFEHWTLPEVCFLPPRFQFYSMGVTSYQGIYIGTPWILWDKSKDRDKHAPVISPGLAVSRDGWAWQQLFVGEAFIPTGAPGSNDARQIRLSSSIVVLENHILLVYGESPDPHVTDMQVDVGIATLRLDGFVAISAGENAGRLLTKPFVLEGDNLYINAACKSGGKIEVAVIDEHGKALPGFAREFCVPVTDDGIKLPVAWRSNARLSQLHGQSVRLEFVMKRAKLYSFWCGD